MVAMKVLMLVGCPLVALWCRLFTMAPYGQFSKQRFAKHVPQLNQPVPAPEALTETKSQLGDLRKTLAEHGKVSSIAGAWSEAVLAMVNLSAIYELPISYQRFRNLLLLFVVFMGKKTILQ